MSEDRGCDLLCLLSISKGLVFLSLVSLRLPSLLAMPVRHLKCRAAKESLWHFQAACTLAQGALIGSKALGLIFIFLNRVTGMLASGSRTRPKIWPQGRQVDLLIYSVSLVVEWMLLALIVTKERNSTVLAGSRNWGSFCAQTALDTKFLMLLLHLFNYVAA